MQLNKYTNNWYKPGSKIKILSWMVFSCIFFESKLPWPSFIKISILKMFGSKVGNSVVIKPGVKIKYPWFFEVGCNSWIGENVWIDNLTTISVGENCCVSQGAYLLTGNHDYKSNLFDLIIKPVVLENCSWVGAQATVCPGVTIGEGAILSVGSVATQDLKCSGIYQGNPAIFKKSRIYRKKTQ
ncbi:acyl transferase [Pseudoalteromonas sp. MSK9-3]|uniref:WcaF family extracellular polysaccharide biosynthesis acetyltransferase n=1 Tax=Pseudoalteromonas sp. MSK9-3 TaxID=1897633 RepID=UPI000E6C4F8A|nr:WcaF family extracellular polysaccharide biosynthesis acetyltransferase [Pseudoalteromonas sp. MSK9-3]RJE75703.1 acyl transferase [Pseudoalteromonas sp. MSK9-3]